MRVPCRCSILWTFGSGSGSGTTATTTRSAIHHSDRGRWLSVHFKRKRMHYSSVQYHYHTVKHSKGCLLWIWVDLVWLGLAWFGSGCPSWGFLKVDCRERDPKGGSSKWSINRKRRIWQWSKKRSSFLVVVWRLKAPKLLGEKMAWTGSSLEGSNLGV